MNFLLHICKKAGEDFCLKFKTKTKDYRLIVRAKIASSECLNDKELDFFARKMFRGFLKPQILKKNLVEYTGPIGISLLNRLKKPISKYEFFFMMEQIVMATIRIHSNNLFVHNLVLDLKNVYINELTKEMQFLYVPLLQKKQNENVLEFMENIIYAVIPDDSTKTDYISKYAYFLKSQKEYIPEVVEKYIMHEEKDVVSTIRKNDVGQSGFMTNKPKDYYEHYDTTMSNTYDEATGLLSMMEDEEATGLLMDEFEATGLLNEEEGTALLQENYVSPTYKKVPSMKRVSTGEEISITKSIFRIGKEQNYVDYCVTGNSAVSRSHADIVTRGSMYFVVDLNSKNKTYINEQPLIPQSEVQIFDGDKLTLANEEFFFRI